MLLSGSLPALNDSSRAYALTGTQVDTQRKLPADIQNFPFMWLSPLGLCELHLPWPSWTQKSLNQGDCLYSPPCSVAWKLSPSGMLKQV